MKTILLLIAAALSSCMTVETVSPDGTIVRVTGPAPGAVETAGYLAGQIIAEK